MELKRSTTIFALVKEQTAEKKLDELFQVFLAQFISVVLYSEIEEKIRDIIKHKLSSFTDGELGYYLSKNMDSIIKRTPKGDIVKLVSQFGDSFKSRFNDAISDDVVSSYSNVILARHQVGHSRGTNITLAEVDKGIAAAQIILLALDRCFIGNVPNNKEMKDLTTLEQG